MTDVGVGSSAWLGDRESRIEKSTRFGVRKQDVGGKITLPIRAFEQNKAIAGIGPFNPEAEYPHGSAF